MKGNQTYKGRKKSTQDHNHITLKKIKTTKLQIKRRGNGNSLSTGPGQALYYSPGGVLFPKGGERRKVVVGEVLFRKKS